MKYFLILIAFLTSCQYVPEMAKDFESVATDTAIKVEISREAMQKDTNLDVTISIQNKD